MLNRFNLVLLIALVGISTAAFAQSAPEAPPSPEAAPAVASAPAAPIAPAAPSAKPARVAPAVPATPARPEAPPAPPEPPRFFQLDYVLKEVENGKVANSRTYSIVVSTKDDGRREQIRTGSRMPIVTQESSTQLKSFQYIDLGVNIDSSSVTERLGQLSLRISAEISSLGPKTEFNQPIIRQNRWESNVTVPIGKAVTVFSSDDIASTRTMQLELKATPISTK